MKLQTSIPVRRDGTVKLQGVDGVTYVFTADEQGDVVCEITDKPTIAYLLTERADFFWPASEDDYAEAQKIMDDSGSDAELNPPGDDDKDGDDDDEVKLPPGADPLKEAQTPPAVAPGKGARVGRGAAAKKPGKTEK